MRENKHSIIVHCQFDKARPEIIRWGEGAWWPKNSLMKFMRQGQGPVQTGTRYRQIVLLPFAPSWDVDVEKMDAKSITRRFLNGMFCGSETVSLEPSVTSAGHFEVRYVMRYRISGLLNKMLWPMVFEHLHNRNIRTILQNLKIYLES